MALALAAARVPLYDSLQEPGLGLLEEQGPWRGVCSPSDLHCWVFPTRRVLAGEQSKVFPQSHAPGHDVPGGGPNAGCRWQSVFLQQA